MKEYNSPVGKSVPNGSDDVQEHKVIALIIANIGMFLVFCALSLFLSSWVFFFFSVGVLLLVNGYIVLTKKLC